jgi:hypothetical protein
VGPIHLKTVAVQLELAVQGSSIIARQRCTRHVNNYSETLQVGNPFFLGLRRSEGIYHLLIWWKRV